MTNWISQYISVFPRNKMAGHDERRRTTQDVKPSQVISRVIFISILYVKPLQWMGEWAIVV